MYSLTKASESQREVYENKLYSLPEIVDVSGAVLCKLWTACLIAFIFLCLEIFGGLYANSMAILSDAAHMFSDLAGFFISILAVYITKKKASDQFSYGYHRAEVIGALASILLILALTVLLLYGATMRIINKD